MRRNNIKIGFVALKTRQDQMKELKFKAKKRIIYFISIIFMTLLDEIIII